MRFMGLGPHEHCDEPFGKEPGVRHGHSVIEGVIPQNMEKIGWSRTALCGQVIYLVPDPKGLKS